MLTTLTVAVVISHSVQHRPITLVHVAGTGPRILVVGCIHGNEPAGIAIVRALERTHPRADLWLVPVLNPDGLAHGTRQNANGVDLNRNFPSLWQHFGHPGSTYYSGPSPFSEPETRAARDLILRVHPQYTVWYHQHMDLVWAYGRSTAAATRASPACACSTARGSPAARRTGRTTSQAAARASRSSYPRAVSAATTSGATSPQSSA